RIGKGQSGSNETLAKADSFGPFAANRPGGCTGCRRTPPQKPVARALTEAARYPTLGPARFSHTKPPLRHTYGTDIGQCSCDVHGFSRGRSTKNQALSQSSLHVARGDLQIAPREVDTDAIAVDAVERLIERDVASAGLERHHQLHLVMHVLGEGRI